MFLANNTNTLTRARAATTTSVAIAVTTSINRECLFARRPSTKIKINPTINQTKHTFRLHFQKVQEYSYPENYRKTKTKKKNRIPVISGCLLFWQESVR